MKIASTIHKTVVRWSLCSVDKLGNTIRLSNWVNNTASLQAGFTSVVNDEYSYGWVTYKEILIVANRFKGVAPVDLQLTHQGLAITDLQEKNDIINRAYIVEYSVRRQYDPYTIKQLEDLERGATLRNLISSKLNQASIGNLSKLLKVLNPSKKVPRLPKPVQV